MTKKEWDNLKNLLESMQNIVDDRRSLRAKLKEVCDFYGNKESWVAHCCENDYFVEAPYDDIERTSRNEIGNYICYGGKLARRILKEEFGGE